MTNRALLGRASGGIKAELRGDWVARMEYTWSLAELTLTRPMLMTDASAIADGRVNIFKDGLTQEDLSALRATLTTSDVRTQIDEVALRLGGTAFSLPAGDAQLTMLVERRKERLAEGSASEVLRAETGEVTPLTVLPEQRQRVDSVYAELGLPLIAGTEGSAYKLLESKLTLRRDLYHTDAALYEPSMDQGSTDPAQSSSTFTATSWMSSVRFQPLDFMFLRGHCGTGFLPPAVSDLTRPTQHIIESSGIIDPARGDEPVGVVRVNAGGNPALVPERSRGCGAGVVFGSQTEPGLRLSVDYSRIVKHLGILSPVDWLFSDPKAFITQLPWRVTRDESGRISEIDASNLNSTRTEVRAWELGFGYTSTVTRFGTLRFSTLATFQPTLLSQVTKTSEILNEAGVGLGPSRYRVASSLSVEHGPWAFGWTGRFVPRYEVSRDPAIVANQGDRFVHSQQYHDVFASYSLPRMQWSADVKLQLGARNLFHQEPPFDAGALRLYSRYGEREIPSYYLFMRADF